jgi:ATP-dependent protease HslVU (ClpYQ) peptidase subunit
MTCIIGLKTENSIYIAGDSSGHTDGVIENYKTSKVVKIATKNNKELLIGFSGSFRLGDILKYKIQYPKISKNNIESDLVNKLIPIIQDTIENEDNISKGEFMLAIHDRLFLIQSDLSILEPENDYSSIGSGSSYALGSLFSTKGLLPIDRLELALSAASHFSPSVGGNLKYQELRLQK